MNSNDFFFKYNSGLVKIENFYSDIKHFHINYVFKIERLYWNHLEKKKMVLCYNICYIGKVVQHIESFLKTLFKIP